jgi:hypothetical protein
MLRAAKIRGISSGGARSIASGAAGTTWWQAPVPDPDISYSAIISFACGLMLVKSVHRA